MKRRNLPTPHHLSIQLKVARKPVASEKIFLMGDLASIQSQKTMDEKREGRESEERRKDIHAYNL